MHVRVTKVQLQPDKVDEAIRIYQDSVVPALKQQPGFHSTQLITDRSSGAGMAVTVWETEAALLAGETGGFYQEQLAKFAPLLTAPPVREVYEQTVSA